MWQSIFSAVQQFANMFIVLFGAGEKLAKAADHIATVAESAAGAYADEHIAKRQKQMKELVAAARADDQRLAIPQS